ncbi:MAG: oligosaccharide flippase family protein, partial [Chloroflexota bacterium]|nr:oligosaccharide flippase family protein [Chloroflexota bacterium]
MSSTVTSPTAAAPRQKGAEAKRQIRGSSLLLVGKLFALAVKYAIPILIVRYLSKADYGAFAYALSFVALGETIITFGLDRAVTRFVPIYEEQQDYDRMFGTIIMVVGTILSLGLALILLFYSLQGVIARSFINDDQALVLLLILIFLSPVKALDTLLNGMFAIFSHPRAIFFRKYLLGPGLQLTVVLLLILGHSDVRFLASGYLAAAAFAVVIYSVILFRVLRDRQLFEHFNLRTIQIPAREILAFTVPLLTTDLVYVVMNTMDAMLLEYFQGTVDVAALRAVQPTAKMNQTVLMSFGLLFIPVASRMFARNDREGINDLYWQNAVWIAVVSFPIFALTFSLARPLTIFLYGERYEQSAIILALLSLGYYFNAALGQNGSTLKVYGKLRYVVAINALVAVLNLGLNLVLIPRYGALGAGVGTFITLVIFN